MKKNIRTNLEGYAFILPGLIFMLVVMGFPLIYNILLSFQNVDVKTFSTGSAVYVGLENYKELFADPTFKLVLKNTFVFTFFSILFQFTIGFGTALFFSREFSLCGPIRGLTLIPYMMAMSVTGILGRNLFDKSSGVVNDLLLKLNLIEGHIDWLLKPETAMTAVIAMNCWIGIPFNMLLITSGLTSIPDEVMEAAKVDGADGFKRFFYVTLPLLRSSILAVLILGFIYTFKAFDLIFIMTAGGPLNGTDVLGTFSYRLSFTQYEFSLGASVAMVLFVILFCIGLLYLKLVGKEAEL